jgi:Anti-sigma-28 factor, FlgM
MQQMNSMDDHRDSELHELRKRVTSGAYRVDPGAVADAIVRRASSVAKARVSWVARSGAGTQTQALAA